MNIHLKGSGVAMITPFLKNHDIDFTSLKNHTEFLISNGIDYLVVMGTSGEAVTLTLEEKKQIFETIVVQNNHRCPIVLGIGGYNTTDVCHQINHLNHPHIAAILSVTPYYNKPSQKGLYLHYKTIAEHTDIPIILYNVPGRTGVNMEADTTLKLATDYSNIIAVKEASGNMNQIMKIIKYRPDNFKVISGDDAITLPLMSVGADGVISVIANTFPKELSTMVRAAINQDFNTARQYHLFLLDYIQVCFKENSPSGIKCLMALKGQIQNELRLPLVPVSPDLENYMKLLLKNN